MKVIPGQEAPHSSLPSGQSAIPSHILEGSRSLQPANGQTMKVKKSESESEISNDAGF